MSKLIRLLKPPKQKGSVKGKEPQMKCSKCGKRTATDPDGLCDHCRFNDVLLKIAERKEP